MDSLSNITNIKTGISKMLLIAYAVVIVVTAYHYHNYPITTISLENISTQSGDEQNVSPFECTIPHIIPKIANLVAVNQSSYFNYKSVSYFHFIKELHLQEGQFNYSLRAPPSSV